jgi:hypothetical protein
VGGWRIYTVLRGCHRKEWEHGGKVTEVVEKEKEGGGVADNFVK